METIEKAKIALTKASQARLHEMEGLIKIAYNTHEQLAFVECVRRLNAHMKALIENTVVLYGETVSEASQNMLDQYEKMIDGELNKEGYTPELFEQILTLD